MIIAMHARVGRGDGTINLYEGPIGPETEKAILAIQEWHDGLVELPASQESINGSDDVPAKTLETDADLAWCLLWWTNSAAKRSEWEVDTGVVPDKQTFRDFPY